MLHPQESRPGRSSIRCPKERRRVFCSCNWRASPVQADQCPEEAPSSQGNGSTDATVFLFWCLLLTWRQSSSSHAASRTGPLRFNRLSWQTRIRLLLISNGRRSKNLPGTCTSFTQGFLAQSRSVNFVFVKEFPFPIRDWRICLTVTLGAFVSLGWLQCFFLLQIR